MRKQNEYFAYILIVVGLYFFMIQFDHPLIHALNSWPVILIGVGLVILFTYMQRRKPHLFFEGSLILLIGIHFYGLMHVPEWPNDSSVFLFIWGFSLFLSYILTKKHLFLSITLIVGSLVFFFSDQLPTWFSSIIQIQEELDTHWPLLLIGLGILLLFLKRK